MGIFCHAFSMPIRVTVASERQRPSDCRDYAGFESDRVDAVNAAESTSGAGARNRTRDLRFTKPLLYQLSYTGTRCTL